jgi:hypothetical protein
MKILSMFLLAAAVSIAAPVTTQVTLTGAGAPLLSDGQYYVGPYTVTIGGVNYAALCVDFLHDTNVGTTWSAYVNNLSTDITHAYNPGNLTAYREEAYLFNLLTSPNADRIDIQHAAWHITDADYQADAAAGSFVALAQANYASVNLAGFQILSSSSANRQQEFLIYNASTVPEPGTFLLMAGGLLLAVVLSRRQLRKSLESLG